MNVFYELIRFYLFSKAVFLGQFQAQNAFKTSSFFRNFSVLVANRLVTFGQGREGNQVNKILGPLFAPFYTRFAVTGSGVTVLGEIDQPKGEVTQTDQPGAADFSPQKGRVGDFAVYYVLHICFYSDI